MHPKIQQLDPLLANQIAAGEVVERPASVIKELVENSIDAGSQKIIVHIEQGGHQLIQVRDDGCGIEKDQVTLALSRHATSKIASLSDLEAVTSLGFRGEALASIAAVSRLTLQTRTREENIGTEVTAQDHHIQVAVKPVAHPPGTTIAVKDLFYNTPARRKFLRGTATEFNHIATVVRRLALCRFDIAFSLYHNDKQEFMTSTAATVKEKEHRVAEVLGNDFMAQALSIEFCAAGMRLWGWIALPTFTRSQGDMQYTYINGRFVRDKLILHALKEAYQDVLFQGRQPAYLLYLEVDPKIVDVNVHPTKHEVRFRNSQLVHQFLRKGVQEALSEVRPVDRIAAHIVDNAVAEIAVPKNDFSIPSTMPTREKSVEVDLLKETALFSASAKAPIPSAPSVFSAKNNSKNFSQPKPQQMEMAVASSQAAYETLASVKSMPQSSAAPLTTHHPLGYAIAQLHDTYILAQNAQGLVMVDMHAAHERMVYERYKKEFELKAIPRQQLLIPVAISLSAEEIQLVEQHDMIFQQLGLTVDWSGPQEIVLRDIPVLLKNADLAQLIRDILADLSVFDASNRLQEAVYRVLGTMACRVAFRSPHKLTLPEMNALLRDIEQTNNSGFCNHGRPTWVQLGFAELDKFFFARTINR